MVKTDWQIGKMIVEKQGSKERAEYADHQCDGCRKQAGPDGV